MKTRIIARKMKYDGSQLVSHWIYENFGLSGDSAVAFTGECRVRENLVDLIDRKNNDFIYSPLMLHFMVEHFGATLPETILRQQQLVMVTAEAINRHGGKAAVRRRGNDLFVNEKKLSVSIATISPVSGLIHLGLNISLNRQVPVPAFSLNELKIKPLELARNILAVYSADYLVFKRSLIKVRAVE